MNTAIAQAIGWTCQQRVHRRKVYYMLVTPEGIPLGYDNRPKTPEAAWKLLPDFTHFAGSTVAEKAASFKAWQAEWLATCGKQWPELVAQETGLQEAA